MYSYLSWDMTIHTAAITNAGSALSDLWIYLLFLITIQIPYRLFVSSIASPLFQIEISSTVEAIEILSALISKHLPWKQNA